MPLPKQIQQQQEALAALEAQTAPQPPDDPTPPEPAPEPAPPAPEPAPSADPRENDVEYWKGRFQTVQGYLEQQSTQRAELAEQNKLLSQQMATLTAQVAALTAKPATPAPEDTPLVTDKDSEMFGADLVDMTKRAAQQEVRRLQKVVETQSKQLESALSKLDQVTRQMGSVAEVQQQVQSDTFMDKLTRAMPDWQTIQDTPECQEWLLTEIPGTTLTWDSALKAHAERGNVAKCVEIFSAFKGSHPKFADAPAPAPAPKPNRRDELARQVAPAKAASGQPGAEPTQRIYSAADFEEMGNQVRRLRSANRYAEAANIEAEMDSALAGGRVRP